MSDITFDQLPQAVSQMAEQLNNIERLLLLQHNQLPNESNEQLLTIQQASEFLNLAVPTIYSMVSRKELPYMKRSKRLYFSRVELSDYLKAGRKKTSAEVIAEVGQNLIQKRK